MQSEENIRIEYSDKGLLTVSVKINDIGDIIEANYYHGAIEYFFFEIFGGSSYCQDRKIYDYKGNRLK